MNKSYLLFVLVVLLVNTGSATTYTIASGKWNDPAVWNNKYPGNVIKPGDIVVVTGLIVMNTAVTVEGKLQVEKGAAMIGQQQLSIAKGGLFINNGNTMVNRIVNEGEIFNTLSMDAITNIDNTGTISNTSNMAIGNNFNNSGKIEGKKSTCMVQNNVVNSSPANVGKEVRMFYGGSSTEAPPVTGTVPAKAESDSTVHSMRTP